MSNSSEGETLIKGFPPSDRRLAAPCLPFPRNLTDRNKS